MREDGLSLGQALYRSIACLRRRRRILRIHDAAVLSHSSGSCS